MRKKMTEISIDDVDSRISLKLVNKVQDCVIHIKSFKREENFSMPPYTDNTIFPCLDVRGQFRHYVFEYEVESFQNLESLKRLYALDTGDTPKLASLLENSLNQRPDSIPHNTEKLKVIKSSRFASQITRQDWHGSGTSHLFDIPESKSHNHGLDFLIKPVDLMIAKDNDYTLLYFNEDKSEDDLTKEFYDTLIRIDKIPLKNLIKKITEINSFFSNNSLLKGGK